MLTEHIQRIEDAYDSVLSMLGSVEPMSYRELLLQDTLKALADVLDDLQNNPCVLYSLCYSITTETKHTGEQHD